MTLTGPRQAGKSTLLKHLFPKLPYVNLESLNTRHLAEADPQGFIEQYRDGAIFDEAQRVPELFSAIQVLVDEVGKSSMFVISGSQNFLLLETISQSLAGRTAIFHLPPLSIAELSERAANTVDERMFKGGYPRIYDQSLDPTEWLGSYLQTYIERDVRSIKNVANLDQFRLFIRMCASRSGQILDLTSLGNDCGISSNTAKSWISLLETSFILYRLQPYHKNYNKRLIKSPKLYFWDSGLLCYLLGIKKYPDLAAHASRGHIFETYILGEMRKHLLNHRLSNELYFWHDKVQEVDCIIELSPDDFIAVEIKSGKTFTRDYLKSIDYFRRISKWKGSAFVVYAGTEEQDFSGNIRLASETNLSDIFTLLRS